MVDVDDDDDDDDDEEDYNYDYLPIIENLLLIIITITHLL